jgi:capsular exopolysaccharide synthesis family protein
MSIIETAIEKTRANQRNGKPSRRAGEGAAERNAGRTRLAASIDPSVRIRGVPASLNLEQCRERRVLLQRAEKSDGSAIAAYRMLRTRLLHRARIAKWTTIAVTSAGPNDGKTLTTLNLALSMAREKSREIVLLDMDMRNPSVFRTLGVDPPRELRHYLERGSNGSQLFMSVQSENLMVAGSVTPTEHASELLASERFDELIEVIKQGTVDPIILIDLPPLLLTDDALVVAPKVDAILVVASDGLTHESDLGKALDMVKEFPIAGVVLNRVSEITHPPYDYGYEYQDGKSGNVRGD